LSRNAGRIRRIAHARDRSRSGRDPAGRAAHAVETGESDPAAEEARFTRARPPRPEMGACAHRNSVWAGAPIEAVGVGHQKIDSEAWGQATLKIDSAKLSSIVWIERMPPQDPFSHDQAVKNLIKDYPEEALEFLAADVVAALGNPIEVEFLDTAVAKDDVSVPGPGHAMDLAIRYTFANDHGVLFVLVEHWSDADRLDLLRTARYYLDLCRRFPQDEILPIALVDDDRPRELVDTVERGAQGESHLRFRTRIVQVPALQLDEFRETANRVALSFTPNMAGATNRVERVMHVAFAFRDLGDLTGFHKFFAFWVVEGRLELNEQREVKQRLKETDMPEIMDWFRQEGIELGKAEGMAEGMRRKALEDARKFREHGVSWEIITSATGIIPADLEA